VPEVELSAGTIEYEDTGGSGPIVVFTHGLLMDSTLWRQVIAGLRSDYRCVAPTLPVGAHRRQMNPDADLTLRGQARIIEGFLERLDLRDVTLVFNDWGGPLVLASEGRAERVARLVPCSCEAFDNYPPGLPGRMVGLAAKMPGGVNAALQPLRFRPLRRSPLVLGWMSKRPIPNEIVDAWLRPALSQSAVRRDLLKYVGTSRKSDFIDATKHIGRFDRPVLVVWAAEDRVMPPEHGRRLADAFPHGRLVEIADSYTLIPEDQPGELVRVLREVLAAESTQVPTPAEANQHA
jgi:pimeloyl-ACP methyl ester carboxylesterase